MAKLNWTFQALEDLDEIGEYIAAYSQQNANELIETIFLKSQLLENFPNIGRRVPEVNISHLRELIVKKYRIIYSTPDIDTVNILTVRHSSQPLPDTFQ